MLIFIISFVDISFLKKSHQKYKISIKLQRIFSFLNALANMHEHGDWLPIYHFLKGGFLYSLTFSIKFYFFSVFIIYFLKNQIQ